jgi:hypothetical protein
MLLPKEVPHEIGERLRDHLLAGKLDERRVEVEILGKRMEMTIKNLINYLIQADP